MSDMQAGETAAHLPECPFHPGTRFVATGPEFMYCPKCWHDPEPEAD